MKKQNKLNKVEMFVIDVIIVVEKKDKGWIKKRKK